jgi:diguanylate cyclase (GGDEF)-like protein/PAS domain S-box-containing protein
MQDEQSIAIAVLALAVAYLLIRAYRVQRESQKREELFQIVTENAADMIALVDVKGNRLYNSPAYRRVLGYSAAELGETSAFDQIHPEDRFAVLEAAREARQTGVGRRLEYRIRHKNGSWRVLESVAGTIRDEKGDVAKLVIVNRDITERKLAEQQAEHNSFHDGLTGLPNRQLFLDRLHSLFERSKRHPERQHALLFIDLDGFKGCNDALGQAVGDQVIVEMGNRINQCLREEDTISRGHILNTKNAVVARLAGDEFTVLLEGAGDPSDAMRIATRILGAVAQPFAVGEREVRSTASIGIAISSSAHTRAQDLLQEADIAMRRAKSLGGSRCEVFDEAMHTSARNRLNLEGELREAIQQNQFRIYYQPVVELATRRITGFEALLRWQHPAQGLISPHKFLDAAEDTGLLVSTGQWVILEACKRMHDWDEAGHAGNPVQISINLSPRQLCDPGFVSDLEAILHDTRIDPTRLQFEITEKVAATDPKLTHSVLSQLKQLRVSVVLDDFGTGNSSLSALRKLPLSALKIDRELVNGMLTDRKTCETVDLIIVLAHKLKLLAVAEGIESMKHFEMLRDLGCDRGQGYFFSQPVDEESAGKLFHEWTPSSQGQSCGRQINTLRSSPRKAIPHSPRDVYTHGSGSHRCPRRPRPLPRSRPLATLPGP